MDMEGSSVPVVSMFPGTLPGVPEGGDERYRWCVCEMSWSARVATVPMVDEVARRGRRAKRFQG